MLIPAVKLFVGININAAPKITIPIEYPIFEFFGSLLLYGGILKLLFCLQKNSMAKVVQAALFKIGNLFELRVKFGGNGQVRFLPAVFVVYVHPDKVGCYGAPKLKRFHAL